MEYQIYMSYIIVGLIWMSLIILFLVLYILFPPEIYYWNKVCDKCSERTAKYRYVVRFIFGNFKPTFHPSKTTITILICNTKGTMVTLQITPRQLDSFIPNCPHPPLRTVRFLLYRMEPLINITTVVINHDGKGSINVTNVEIQDLKNKYANIAYVGVPMEALPKQKAMAAQRYPAGTQERRPIEPELKVSVSLTSLEFIIFFWLTINSMILSTVYLIPCPKVIICNDYRYGYLSSAFAGLTASAIGVAIFVFTSCFHRCVIKRLIYKGVKCCNCFRYMFLLLAIAVGAASGTFAMIMSAENRKFPPENPLQDFFHELFWMFALAIALIVFFLFWVSLISVIGYLIGFFSEPEEPKVDLPVEEKTVRTADTTEEEDGALYMQIIKDNKNVKSISQYGGLSKNRKGGTTSPSTDKKADESKKEESGHSKGGKSPKRTASTESTGETGEKYYQQLMRGHGKVKSVSQYKGPGK